ncbi:MAG: thioesterase [Bacteroidetes bacterium B1(2017)]|nr:MAG: thioesterase [Bacteroidetes bacterium B1(2017)]
MFVSETKLRVRYAETDQMGYVYYGNYATYYEVARVEALRDVDLSYKLFEDTGIMMPVLSLSCNYVKPAKYDDLLTIKTFIKEMPGVRIHFYYEVFNEAGVLLNRGETTLVCIDMKTQRPCGSPAILIEKLKPYFTE